MDNSQPSCVQDNLQALCQFFDNISPVLSRLGLKETVTHANELRRLKTQLEIRSYLLKMRFAAPEPDKTLRSNDAHNNAASNTRGGSPGNVAKNTRDITADDDVNGNNTIVNAFHNDVSSNIPAKSPNEAANDRTELGPGVDLEFFIKEAITRRKHEILMRIRELKRAQDVPNLVLAKSRQNDLDHFSPGSLLEILRKLPEDTLASIKDVLRVETPKVPGNSPFQALKLLLRYRRKEQNSARVRDRLLSVVAANLVSTEIRSRSYPPKTSRVDMERQLIRELNQAVEHVQLSSDDLDYGRKLKMLPQGSLLGLADVPITTKLKRLSFIGVEILATYIEKHRSDWLEASEAVENAIESIQSIFYNPSERMVVLSPAATLTAPLASCREGYKRKHHAFNASEQLPKKCSRRDIEAFFASLSSPTAIPTNETGTMLTLHDARAISDANSFEGTPPDRIPAEDPNRLSSIQPWSEPSQADQGGLQLQQRSQQREEFGPYRTQYFPIVGTQEPQLQAQLSTHIQVPENASDGLSMLDVSQVRALNDSTYLLCLAEAIGGLIPKLLIERTNSAQLRWDDSGSAQSFMATEAGLDSRLIDILSNETRLLPALESFERRDEPTEGWRCAVSLRPERSDTLCVEAVKWVCFAFPQSRHRNAQFISLVRSLYPLLRFVLHEVDRQKIPGVLRDQVAEALLASSTIPDLEEEAMLHVVDFIDDQSPLYIRIELALRRSISFRLHGDYVSSDRVLEDFLCCCGRHTEDCLPLSFQRIRQTRAQGNNRGYAMYQLLHRSHLENLVQSEQYGLALNRVGLMTDAQATQSPLEQRTQPSRALTTCKIFRSNGDFETVREMLEICRKTLTGLEPIHSQVLCQLADTYSNLRLPDVAEQLIQAEIAQIRKTGPHSKALQRILISSLELELQPGRYESAIIVAKELHSTFERAPVSDVSGELLHIRFLVATARLSHMKHQLDKAGAMWTAVLDHVQKYKSFESEGFIFAAAHLSLSHVHLQNKQLQAARASFEKAKTILSKGSPDYWVPTLSHWTDYIKSEIHSNIGWS